MEAEEAWMRVPRVRASLRELLSLRDAYARLFNQRLMSRPHHRAGVGGVPLDVVETDGGFIVKALVAGVRPEELEVTVQGDRLSIRGEIVAEEEWAGERCLVRELPRGTVRRSVTLPVAVDADRVEARCEDGVLLLRLPKAQAARSPRIPVTGARPALASLPGGGTAREAADQATATASDVGQGSRNSSAAGDEVTAQSQESFPASDPPSWTPEKV